MGEISLAMEKVFGRHRAEVKTLAGVYGAAYEGDAGYAAIQKDVDAFAIEEGRRPRMLVVKMGQDVSPPLQLLGVALLFVLAVRHAVIVKQLPISIAAADCS